MRWRKQAYRVALCGLILCSFYPLFGAEYVNFDDAPHYSANPLATDHTPGSFWRIFFTPNSVNETYIPLTIASYNLEHGLFGVDPGVSHGINILLHLAVVLILFRVGTGLGLSLEASFLASLLFAIHPMHVESVGWVTSRKDVLYGLFFVTSLLYYLSFLKSGKLKSYIFSLLFAGMSILSKPMALSLPFVLFLIDWLKGVPVNRKTLLQKIPFGIVVLPVAAVTFLQNIRAVHFVWPDSFLVWLWCPSVYIGKFLWPSDLSPLYSFPLPVKAHLLFYIGGALGFVLLSWMAFRFRASRWLAFGLLFYVVSSFFLWRFDYKDITFIADRYMYIPSIGFCLFAGWGSAQLFQKTTSVVIRSVMVVFLVIGTFFLSSMTYQQTFVWQNSWNNWTRVAELYPENTLVYGGRAKGLLFYPSKGTSIAFMEYIYKNKFTQPCGRTCGTIVRLLPYFKFLMIKQDTQKAFRIEPHCVFVTFMGRAYWQIGDSLRAEREWKRAITMDPSYPEPYHGLALKALQDRNNGAALKYFCEYIKRIDFGKNDPQAERFEWLRSLPEEKRTAFLEGAILRKRKVSGEMDETASFELLIPVADKQVSLGVLPESVRASLDVLK